MAISRVGANATTTTSSALTGTFNSTNPAGIASGDFIIATFDVNRDITLATPPAGYTLIRAIVDTTTTKNWLYRRIADGTAADVAAWGWSQPTAVAFNPTMHVVAYRDVDTTTPFIVENGVNETGAAAALHTAPSITNTDANAWGVFHVVSRGASSPMTWTAGTGLTEVLDNEALLNSANNIATQTSDTNGPFATGAVAFSGTASQTNAAATMWAAFLKPAGAAAAYPYELLTPTPRYY